MSLYLGIDAGGTKTDCAISNGAELLGQATGASCKLARVGKELARTNLQDAMARAAASARVLERDIQHVCIGMAGASLTDSVRWAQETSRGGVPSGPLYG